MGGSKRNTLPRHNRAHTHILTHQTWDQIKTRTEKSNENMPHSALPCFLGTDPEDKTSPVIMFTRFGALRLPGLGSGGYLPRYDAQPVWTAGRHDECVPCYLGAFLRLL